MRFCGPVELDRTVNAQVTDEQTRQLGPFAEFSQAMGPVPVALGFHAWARMRETLQIVRASNHYGTGCVLVIWGES